MTASLETPSSDGRRIASRPRPSQIVMAAVLLALLALLGWSGLRSLLPREEPVTAQDGPSYIEPRQVGSVVMVLSVSPAQVGEGLFRIVVTDRSGATIRDARRVTLLLDMLDHPMGAPNLVALPEPDGSYQVRANSLTMVGRWRISATVDGGAADGAAAAYEVLIGPRVARDSGRPVLPYRWEPRNFGGRTVLGLELAIVGTAVVLLALWLARAKAQRIVGFLLGATGVCAGGYLAIGSLLAPLLPSEYLRNPTPEDRESIARGRPVYEERCASCHGPAGRGDGPQAKGLNPPPADLAGGHIFAHSDEDLFYWVTNGIDGTAMPALKDQISEQQRWDVVNYVRSLAPALE
ncbi:MAG: c-type cytochrome [Chloroflexi bacterium]|nr:c-type cytochrome [Chloroflexota bacterium]